MLFQRSKDKQESMLMETPRHVEEETVRRWRDMAAAREKGNNKVVIGRFEDDMVHSTASGSYTLGGTSKTLGETSEEYSLGEADAPSWPSQEETQELDSAYLQGQNFELGESQVYEDEPESIDQLRNRHFGLGELSLDEDEDEPEASVQIPTIQRRPVSRTGVSDHSLSIEEDLKHRFGANIRSALGKGTVIEGTFRFDSPVCVEGTLSGEVFSTSALIVGEGARVTGKITVGSLIVIGSVEGSVEANELIEIRDGGELLADIITRRIAIEDGACFNGCCTLQE